MKLGTLLENEDFIPVIEKAIDIEENGGTGAPWNSGWDYTDISETPQTLSKMAQEGILDISKRTSSSPNRYELFDLDKAKDLLELVNSEDLVNDDVNNNNAEQESSGELEIPDDLFDNIIGHEPVKNLLLRSLKSDEQIHFRLQGESSTAKSLFLTEIERLEGSKYKSASGMTEVGLLDILIDQKPNFLLFDEIDKADKSAYSPLYEMTEHGRVQKTISGSDMTVDVNTSMIATLNHPEKLPQELRNRMIKLEFEQYTDDEYIEVVTGVLSSKFDLDEEVAEYIAEYQLNELGQKNVREPIQIAKLADNDIDDVKTVIESIEEYRL